MTLTFQTGKSFADQMDRNDQLRSFRAQFCIPKIHAAENSAARKCIYLCGNSLGLQPQKAQDYVEQELANWATLGVEGHFRGKYPWLSYHELLAEPLARVVGAEPKEVIAMNTLTVNQHLMMVSFFQPSPTRYKILIGSNAFPSDHYAVSTHLKFHGLDPRTALVELPCRPGESVVVMEDIEALLEEQGKSIALVFVEGVNYYTGQALDLNRITRAAQAQGCRVGFDLAHGVGNIPYHLHQTGADFAVWCSYKYLNGGPGCIAGCFVHEKHRRDFKLPRLGGWWGHNKTTRFLMGPEFDPLEGAEGWQLSNPPILPLACLRAALDLFDEAGIDKLREKSVSLTGYLAFLLDHSGKSDRIRIITPRGRDERGCQLSILVKEGAKELNRKLIAQGLICDFREPDCVRVAPVPLYNSYSDVYDFVNILSEIL